LINQWYFKKKKKKKGRKKRKGGKKKEGKKKKVFILLLRQIKSINPRTNQMPPLLNPLQKKTHMLTNRLVNRKESDERDKRSGGGSSIKILATAAVTARASLMFKFLRPY